MSSIVFCFGSEKRKNDYVPPHAHGCWELVCYRTCVGRSRIGERTYSIEPNTVILIPPNVAHDELHEQNGNLCCIGFESEFNVGKEAVLTVNDQDAVLHTVDRIMQEARGRLADRETMLSLLLDELLLLLKRNARQQRLPAREFALARRFLEENYSVNVNFSDLARSCGYSQDYFRHKFKEAYGISPQQYLIRCRMEHAQKMLNNTDKNCTEIAFLCGFSDSAQFSTMFRRAYGISPKKYAMKEKISPKK